MKVGEKNGKDNTKHMAVKMWAFSLGLILFKGRIYVTTFKHTYKRTRKTSDNKLSLKTNFKQLLSKFHSIVFTFMYKKIFWPFARLTERQLLFLSGSGCVCVADTH